jgi:hypothetical protein
MYLGPYLELFARAERPLWTTWGNEVAPPSLTDNVVPLNPAERLQRLLRLGTNLDVYMWTAA